MIGIVNHVESGVDVFVEFINGEKFRIHPDLLRLAEPRTDYEESDLVLVRSLVAHVQSYIPNWSDDLKEVRAMTRERYVQWIARGLSGDSREV